MPIPRRVIVVSAAAFAVGLGIHTAPPVFIAGKMPIDAPDGGCRVEKTGLLRGQTVCELSAWLPPETAQKAGPARIALSPDGGHVDEDAQHH